MLAGEDPLTMESDRLMIEDSEGHKCAELQCGRHEVTAAGAGNAPALVSRPFISLNAFSGSADGLSVPGRPGRRR